jgi:MFS family permease
MKQLISQMPTFILKAVVAGIGILVLALCVLALPAGIITDKVGYYRPILIGLYVPAVPFFIALYQALKLLGYIDHNRVFSQLSVRALEIIKYCAIAISGLFAAGMPYIYYAAERDDAPGVIAVGLVIIFASIIIATAAGVFQRLLQSAVDIKRENDLTV